jgi:hypothetical protein
MLNQDSITAVNDSAFSEKFRKPLYNSYGFANLPQTILKAFGIRESSTLKPLPENVLGNLPTQYNKVIFLFIDAFGWRFFEKYKDTYPVLQKLVTDGVVSKLTSQFPSTTAAHVTTMNTGLPVGQHGLYEWNYYEPTLDAVIQPLFFSYSGDKERDTLLRTNANAEKIFPNETIHHTLANHAIPSNVYISEEFRDSPYSAVVMNGSTTKPFRTLSEGFVNLTTDVTESNKGFFYFYYGEIDKMGHKYGPESPQFEAEVNTFLHALEQFVIKELDGGANDTLLLMTADHGQVYADPAQAIYINLEYPELIPFLKTTAEGKPIVPAGSGRDFFLHVIPDQLVNVKTILSQKLKGKAEVYETADLIAQGFFGPLPVSDTFLSRVGDLVILPYAGNLVWWYKEGLFKQKHFGHHGGSTPEEMETILYAYAGGKNS